MTSRAQDERTVVYEQAIDDLGLVRIVPLAPDRDIDLVVSWVHQPRARFWGMLHEPRERVREIYEYLDGLPSHHVYLVFLDESPVALLQTYDPAADPVGECYPVQPGDLGVHLLMARADNPRPGFTAALALALMSFLRTQPDAPRRIVVEPDAENSAAIDRLRRIGFTLGPEVDLPTKRARLAFLTLDRDMPSDLAIQRSEHSGTESHE